MRTVLVLLALLVLAGASGAEADTVFVYSYTGDTFGAATGVYTLADRITGQFVVDVDLVYPGWSPANGIAGGNLTAGLLSYSMTDGHQTLTEANSTVFFRFGGLDPGNHWLAGAYSP